jgi:hypothetical protein
MTYKNLITKICAKCREVNALSEFYPDRRKKNGLQRCCKACADKLKKEQSHTKYRLLSNIYYSQRARSKKKNHPVPCYTLDEFRAWALAKRKFNRLYKQWVKSGYKKDFVPSADRVDDYKPYTFDNIQWITWSENKAKGHADMKAGINKKKLKAVVQMDLDGNFIAEYYSQNKAFRETGCDNSSISKCCKRKLSKVGDFRWKYA